MKEQQIDLKEFWACIGELYFEVRFLKRSLSVANERVKQISEQLAKEVEKNKEKKHETEEPILPNNKDERSSNN